MLLSSRVFAWITLPGRMHHEACGVRLRLGVEVSEDNGANHCVRRLRSAGAQRTWPMFEAAPRGLVDLEMFSCLDLCVSDCVKM